jgi:photosystem II stability/assembly factor-like uncharacterized protein
VHENVRTESGGVTSLRTLAFAVAGAFVMMPAAFAAEPRVAGPSPLPAAQSAEPTTAPSETPAPPPFARLRWREIGPAVGGGRVTSVVGSARDPKLYYVGTAAGGVWRSTNGAETWTPVFDRQPVSSIGAVAIDPTNDDTVWVGTGETNPRNDVTYGGGVFKSTDGAKTWTRVGLENTLQISSIAIDPRDPKVVIVGAMGDFFADSDARGIYRTDDGGQTWTKTLYVGPRSGVSDLAMDPKDPSILYAGVWEFRRQPWTFASGGPDDGLYRSIDGGKTWTKLTGNGLPEDLMGRIAVAIAPSDPRRVYALIESAQGVLWRSDDGGASWVLATKDTLANQRPFYFSHIRVDPEKRDHVYAISEMLAESKDAGKTFKAIADDVHVDFHAMWIAPNDTRRMIVGEDGGYALTLDGGSHWSFSRNLAIGQVYHVGYDDGSPYRVCAPLQDNNGFCGPSNGLSPDGITDAMWERVVGGDGQWAWPDPTDPNLVWTDLQDGRLSIFDRTARRNVFVSPYVDRALEAYDIAAARYRFNWNSPIAFSPWEPGTTWFGGDVVFATRDRGMHWTPISPDLTKNDKAHQQPAGGPITHDVSGAEYTDTILDIEASPLRRGEIWVGTDDGLVQLTRDGGGTWLRVTPEVAPDGRFEIVAPSTLVAGTAYAVYDRHEVGDRAPHVYVTQDWGATWSAIDGGLPADQPARSIRPDTRNPHLVYVGLERSVWASWDDGAHWRSLQLNLPPAPVYDIRVQPRWNDLLLATHGRSLWILDDLAVVQNLPSAEAAGTMVFEPRPAYAFSQHSDEEGSYTRFAGQNPPNGAIVDFYQAKAAAKPPPVEVLNSGGRVIRHIRGTRKVGQREVPLVTNDAGINRVVWDFREDGPIRWMGAAREEYRGPRVGVAVVPGTYAVRVTLAGATTTRALVVRPDPRARLSRAALQTAHDFYAREIAEYSQVDAALNRLDSVIASGNRAIDDAGKAGNAALVTHLQSVVDRAKTVRAELTADYHNDEDSIQRPGRLREDLETFTRGFISGPVTPALRDYAARVEFAYRATLRDVQSFFATDVPQADAALEAAGLPPLENTPNPPEPSPSPASGP